MTKTKVLSGYHKLWRFSISFEFCKKDMWFGLYWEDEGYEPFGWIDFYLCIIPCFPIHIRYYEPRSIYFNPEDDPNYNTSEETKNGSM